jgi:hypothetical protein
LILWSKDCSYQVETDPVAGFVWAIARRVPPAAG